MSEIVIIDTVPASSLEEGDQIVIEGDLVEIRAVRETDDIDEVVVTGYSNETGDVEHYSLYADDYFDLWGV